MCKKSEKLVKNLILIISTFLILVSCKGNHIEIQPSKFIIKIQKQQKVGKSEYGEIIYTPQVMDTLKLKAKDKREVLFCFSIYNNQTSIEFLETQTLDYHYLALKDNDSIIPFYIKVDEIGDYFIEGFVKDSIYIHDFYGNNKSRIITSKVKVSEKIKIIK